MFSRILAIFVITCLLHIESAPAVSKARQFLPALPGYIPVYIRPGDTPLEEINPDLAEAFNSYARKHGRLIFGRSNKVEEKTRLEHPAKEVKDDISLVAIDDDLVLEDNSVNPSTKSSITNPQHIQKIPRA